MAACQDDSGHNVYRVVIDGLTVRFTEEHFFVGALVEGKLSEERLRTLQEKTVATLSRLEQTEWQLVD